MLNVIVDAAIRGIARERAETLSLSAVFAALARDEIESFPALRPHQRHAWHAFLVQLGALALMKSGDNAMPDDADAWKALLRGLTPDHPDDAPWRLVSPPDKPALLQPPIPDGLKAIKNVVDTPDALDMLVTAKNHDLKQQVMWDAAPDDWLFALVTLQTMEGFLGAGNYGASRMNGGFANRPAFGTVPSGRPGAAVRRDVERLVALRRDGDPMSDYAARDGLGLLWLEPWDGTTSLRQRDLDPLYIDICRRVRLVADGGRIAARAGGSKVPRVLPVPGGATGDPWAPTVLDKEALKVLTVDAGGFGYRRVVRLLFEQDGHKRPPLALVASTDAREGLVIVARALTRGQGKTEGLHERRIPVTKVVRKAFASRDTEPLARAATDRVALAGEIQNRVLKPALFALFENGPDKIDYKNNGADGRARGFLARFDRAVDLTFFDDLWREFEPGASEHAVRSEWVQRLVNKAAEPLLDEADSGMSKAVGRQWRAISRAKAIFWSAARRNEHLKPYWPETARDDAA